MILNFTVGNYLSFYKPQTLSFEATAERAYSEYFIVQKGKYKVLKLALVFGPNASGKSNLIKALRFLRSKVLYQPIAKFVSTDFVPFRFSDKSVNQPGSFELEFFIGDQLFTYRLVLDKERILTEELYFYPTIRKALLFRRYLGSDGQKHVDFGKYIDLSASEKKSLINQTLPNGTVLAAYQLLDIKSAYLDKVVKYFKHLFTPEITTEPGAFYHFIVNLTKKDKDLSRFIRAILPKADFNITDFKIQEKKVKLSPEEMAFLKHVLSATKLKDNIPQEVLENKLHNAVRKQVLFVHKVKDRSYILPEKFQSDGTLKFIALMGLIYLAIKNQGVIIFDELEASLHYELQQFLLMHFIKSADNAQLLATTHNLLLIDQDLLRRDVIWFTEKNRLGATELYSLAEFGLHKNVNPLHSYLSGKLGAYPLTVKP